MAAARWASSPFGSSQHPCRQANRNSGLSPATIGTVRRAIVVSSDPLLQPFQLKHLTLKNRLMISSHEPNYHEDGMPKDRYRLYHVERAKGGVALTMTAGSAVVSADSPPAF